MIKKKINNHKKKNISFMKIKKILTDRFKIKRVTLNLDLYKQKSWDSIKHLEFIMILEQEFKKKLLINKSFNSRVVCDFIKILEDQK